MVLFLFFLIKEWIVLLIHVLYIYKLFFCIPFSSQFGHLPNSHSPTRWLSSYCHLAFTGKGEGTSSETRESSKSFCFLLLMKHNKLGGKQDISMDISLQMSTIHRKGTICYFFYPVSTVNIAPMDSCGIGQLQTCDRAKAFLLQRLGALINHVFNASPVFLCLVAWFLWLLCALAKCLFTFPVFVFPTSETKRTFSAQPLPTHPSPKGFIAFWFV